MRHSTIAGLVVAAFSSAIAGTAWGSAVPISYSQQDRSVSATSLATGFARGGTSAASTSDPQSRSQTAGNFGAFNGDAAVESNLGPLNATSMAAAVQESSLNSTGFSASGSVMSDAVLGVGGMASAYSSSTFQITFNVATAEGYVFAAHISGLNVPAVSGDLSASIKLTNKAGRNVFAPITSVNLSNFAVAGTLTPGTYLFDINAKAVSVDSGIAEVNYGISLLDGPVVGPADGINGIVPAGVPLPSSGLTAMVMLSGLGIIRLARRGVPALAPILKSMK